ncbi:radical SAM protein [Halobacteriaceae archaeon GCM10025711]
MSALGTPRYRQLDPDEFDRRVAALRERYADCDLCAHACGVDRTAGKTGVCGVDDTAVVASAFAHTGEEACLSGTRGSGTVFLSHCNLRCAFCQNYDVSQEGDGRATTPEAIVERILDLAARGCHNVNFVTPTHFAPTLADAVRIASDRGLSIPVVWNCGGYENPTVLELLDGVVDIYMPDVKWADDEAARRYSGAPDYWDHARASLREMHRQVGDLTTDADGLATGGLLVRHLVMPGHVESAKRILAFVAEELSPDTYVNLMAQYRPAYRVPRDDRYEAIDRRVSRAEYAEVVAHARDLGLTRLDVDDPGW